MLFSTHVFLDLFLPLVLAVCLACPTRAANLLLLVASLFFYAWGEPVLVAAMLLSIAANYLFGLAAERWRGRPAGSLVVAAAVAANLGILGWFKYGGFLAGIGRDVLAGLFGFESQTSWPQGELPVGISFYTFQALSYVLDVARGRTPAERSPLRVALYVALFPQLIAGPIVRYVEVAAELRHRTPVLAGFADGARRFALGLGRKMLVANPLAKVADAAFGLDAGELSATAAWLGLLCYSLQIYHDFAGYSDMAIGLGRMLAFRFPENFDHPYVSQSVAEFWRRWHMTLSHWFRDYLYIPLGGNRGSRAKTFRNLLVVFLLCGLWHGASWNFVVWGAWHGGFLFLERLAFGGHLAASWRPVRHAYTLLVVACGWILFRAESLPHALRYFAALWGAGSAHAAAGTWAFPLAPPERTALALTIVLGVLGSMPLASRWRRPVDSSGPVPESEVAGIAVPFRRTTRPLGDVALLLILVASLAVMSANTYNPFIYFQF